MPEKELRFSVIVPVYNRPDEIKELLESLTTQTDKDFEIIIVEDGSTEKSDKIVENFSGKLKLKYFFKQNSGPGTSRNYGCLRAEGNYFIVLDSDCIVPAKYIETVRTELNENYADAYGGPDAAHPDFTDFQKAVNYSMTSFLTTGGIRGKNEKIDKFYPRSFNMGFSKEVFDKTGGFSKMRFGEDIDFSIRILKEGFKTRLIKNAFVWHKRRTNAKQFFKQIYNSGIARINLYKKYPESLKIVHFFPAVFTAGFFLLIIMSVFVSAWFISFIFVPIAIIFTDSTLRNKSLKIGALSVISTYIQLFAYGFGFIFAYVKRILLGKSEFEAFKNTFYE